MSNLGSIHDNMLSALQNHSRTMTRLQEQIASGMRVLRASDDPGAAFQIMDIHSHSRSLETYSGNLDRVVLDLQQASSVMLELSGMMTEARELLTQAASGIYTESQRTAMAVKIESVLEEAVSFANTKVVGRYLFGGESTTTAPYVVERTDGHITAVNYQGSLRNFGVPVASGVEQSPTLVGEKVFRAGDRSEPVFLGDTGAGAGIGTSTVRGDVWLTVVHDTTAYGGATGVAPGASSADGDTIIGTSHKLYIDVDNVRVRLGDGLYTTYNPATDDDLRLENAAGDVVYVDMTNLAGGLSGTTEVSITATGKISIDDLATTADLNAFSNNEVVTDSRTGRILYVDAGQIVRTGLEPVRVVGTYDVFGMLIGARDLLLNERDLASQDRSVLFGKAIDSLDEVMGALTNSMTSVGGRLQAMDTLSASLVNIQSDLDIRAAGLQDADIVEIVTELVRTQTYYELTMSATAKVMSLSLLDFL